MSGIFGIILKLSQCIGISMRHSALGNLPGRIKENVTFMKIVIVCMQVLYKIGTRNSFFFQFAVFLGHKSDQKTRDGEAAQLISYLIYRY